MYDDLELKNDSMVNEEVFGIRECIHTSWNRCRGYGLERNIFPKPPKVPQDQLQDLINKHRLLIDTAQGYIEKVSLVLPKNSSMVGISDRYGVLIYLQGDAQELERMGYKEGYIHTEQYMGSNAVGTCLYTGKPAVITGREHYFNALKNWAGYAAPICNDNNDIMAVLMVIAPLASSNFNFLGTVTVAALGIERELNLSSKDFELMDSNRTLAEFSDDIVKTASMLSHEIRNSLSNISAYVQLLRLEKVLDGPRAEKVLVEIARVNKLLDDFKGLARPVKMNFGQYSLNKILCNTIEVMGPRADMSKVRIKLLMPKKGVKVKGDKDALKQVFVNIIENAIQAMDGGGELTIRLLTSSRTGNATVRFRDTGKGIPKENLKEIFKPFYTTKETGSGLGLPICQNIIRCHGGSIQVKSDVGAGTTFTVTIPYIS